MSFFKSTTNSKEKNPNDSPAKIEGINNVYKGYY